MSMEGSVELGCLINKEGRIIDVMFLAEFIKEQLGECPRSGWKQPHMEIFLGVWIDCGVQPVPLIVELDHGFVNAT